MDKWVEEKFDDRNVRKYTRKMLKSNRISNIYRRFSVTTWIIIINVIIFLATLIAIKIFGEETIFSLFAIQADSFFSGRVWTVLTSMFMHGGIEHLLANMFSLFFIGNFVERLIGRKRFFWFYILSGIFAGIFYVFLSFFFWNFGPMIGGKYLGELIVSNPKTYAVGASGAIFALLGLLAVLTPKNRVFLIAGPLIAIILQSILVSIFPDSGFVSFLNILVTVYVFVAVFSMLSFNPKRSRFALPLEMPFWLLPIVAIVPLIIIGIFVPLPIGNTAHLGGLVAGIFYAYMLKAKYKKKTEMINRYFSR